MPKVLVALSGGVDSSVAAALLLERGYEVEGAFMNIMDPEWRHKNVDYGSHACFGPSATDNLEEAAHICYLLGIRFHVIDLWKEFRENVIEYFRKEYLEGRTPNPCVVCNRTIKFGLFIQKAREVGLSFHFFATGHYVRILDMGGRLFIRKGRDRTKDQSYFLYTLTQARLASLLFPLGGHTKEEIRSIARKIGLGNADRAESQDFAGKKGYSVVFEGQDFLPGDIVDKKGNLLGTHRGIVHYTVGQRKGLGIASKSPLYVLEIHPESNTLVVGPREELLSRELFAKDIVLAQDLPPHGKRLLARIRQQHKEAWAYVVPVEDMVRVVFDEPQSAITPGQSVVFYEGDVVMGGGIIV